MRYHFEKPETKMSIYGQTYYCNHPVYNRCTLFKIGNKGLAVIQQRFDSDKKYSWWDTIDSCLTDILYLHPNFKKYFDEKSGVAQNGLYPTVCIRQVMWGLKMKPLERSRWETYFDRKLV